MLDMLTDRQREIYTFIRDHVRQKGRSPTVREIGAHFGINSPNGVSCHLKALEKKGVVKKDPLKARAIQVVDPQAEQAEEDWLKLRLTLLWWFGTTDASLIHEAMNDVLFPEPKEGEEDKHAKDRVVFDVMLERSALIAGS